MKKFVSIMLTLAMIASMASFVLASNLPTITDPALNDGMTTAVGKILGAIKWVGYAIAAGMLIYIGIKYTMSAANEKADLKKGLINYVIGAILIGAAATVIGWISYFVDNNVSAS